MIKKKIPYCKIKVDYLVMDIRPYIYYDNKS